MSTFAIGDIQGCYTQFQALLKKINFNQQKDQLWFTGDLVNRGPNSLKTLRFVKSLQENAITVLGNHDLHLIAVAHGTQAIKPTDTFQDILQANDRTELIEWLCQQRLLHHNQKLGFTMTHAGIAPQWDLEQAQKLALEVETTLQGQSRLTLLENMYGNKPKCWNDELTGIERLRCIINYFTRMRFCDSKGCLNLNYKGEIENAPAGLIPWFAIKKRKMQMENIVFGHWAALRGITNTNQVFAIDTGCAWGKQLTAMYLETGERVSVS